MYGPKPRGAASRARKCGEMNALLSGKLLSQARLPPWKPLLYLTLAATGLAAAVRSASLFARARVAVRELVDFVSD